MTAVIGSLCSGYGGLDQGLSLALGGDTRTAWHVEYDKQPSKILAHRYPDVPNHGDVKTTDWSQVEPIDWLTAGYPCQPFSHAGLRKGHDDPRHLWPDVARCIGVLRPRGVLLENVRGHVSLGLADVLADLSGLGYDATWGVVRAADAGAPHGRARIFIVAADARSGDAERRRTAVVLAGAEQRTAACFRDAAGCESADLAPDARGERHGRGEDAGVLGRLDSPDAGEARERQRARGVAEHRGAAAAADADNGRRGEPDAGQRRVPVADTHGADVAADAGSQRRDGRTSVGGTGRVAPIRGEASDHAGDGATSWGDYAPAIARWERILGRPAPRPTEPGRNGERLSPRFVEWLMGLHDGWVTDVPGLPRNAQLKALGNGVVPQQAALACRMLGVTAEAVAA